MLWLKDKKKIIVMRISNVAKNWLNEIFEVKINIIVLMLFFLGEEFQ